MKRECDYFCGSTDHQLSRRGFLGAAVAGVGGMMGLSHPLAAKQLASSQKRVLMVYLLGGVSQLESWDPKPNTDTGGPFRAIQTSVPGIHISELLPHTAKRMQHLALIRGLNISTDDHGLGDYIMNTGRRREPNVEYPHLGAVMAKLLGSDAQALPGYIHITPGGGGFGKQDATFLGPRFASVSVDDGKPPANLNRPTGLTESTDAQRDALRKKLNEKFAQSRRTAQTDAYTESFDQAEQFMKQGNVFATDKEDPKTLDRYGRHDFGRHCLLARRLLEAGVTFVKVTHTNYDTHHENFDFHLEQLGEFDSPFATLLDDLHDRGMMESTLIIVASEFGRTPRINERYGRDHWGRSLTTVVGGCGIKGGAVVGKTNANGTAVAEREVNGGHLFHTYFKALGLDPKANHYPDERPVPMADPKASAIGEVLA